MMPFTHEKVNTSNIRLTKQVIFSNTYAYMYTTTMNEKRVHDFEKEQGRFYGRVWRREREGRNVFIL